MSPNLCCALNMFYKEIEFQLICHANEDSVKALGLYFVAPCEETPQRKPQN